MFDTFLTSVLLMFVYATFWFIFSLLKKRNDIADIAWGIGYIALCFFWFFYGEKSGRVNIMYFLILIWGIRLASHIYLRNRGKAEDFRYKKWREEWGKYFFVRSYLQIYLLQAFILLFVISSVLITASFLQSEINILDFIGIFVWLFGFFFEAIGDAQLKKFVTNKENAGKIMQTGLWRYTRHPNYFGEVTMWWGIWLIALSSPWGFFGIIGPLTITFLILFVSGVPMLEKKYIGNILFEDYKRRTSVFFPWFPKK